ncbi:hypothetical protein [Eubacterium aggregans]|uniref:hypothetical protein n=1 Tax=Eubacterium aggregans TaxID=81409 RepID=UPI003F3E64FF
MALLLLLTIVMPVFMPKKVYAIAGIDDALEILSVVLASKLVISFSGHTMDTIDRENSMAIISDFWAKASEDGKVSEYQAQLGTLASQLTYDASSDAFIWQGIPHVSGRLLQTLADVIADYYYNDTPRSSDISSGNINSLLILTLVDGYEIKYYYDNTYITESQLLSLIGNAKWYHCPTYNEHYVYYDYYNGVMYNVVQPYTNNPNYQQSTGQNLSARSTLSGQYIGINLKLATTDSFKHDTVGYDFYNYLFFTKTKSHVNRQIKALPIYALPAQIPADTVTAIQDGSDTIPTDGFASITYEGDQWTYEGDTYYIIDRDAEPEPTPTPTPTTNPTPTPDHDQPADNADTLSWLKAIYLKLVSNDGNIAQMLPTVIDDLVLINDTLKDISTGGGLTGDDSEAQQSAFTNLFSGLLEFLRAALLPTQELNLAQLNVTPEDLNNKFPFSVAGDIARLFTIFEAAPVAPVISIDFDISMLGGDVIPLKMDFSHFDNYAGIFRNLFFVSFLITLVWMTFKMFMGGCGDE